MGNQGETSILLSIEQVKATFVLRINQTNQNVADTRVTGASGLLE